MVKSQMTYNSLLAIEKLHFTDEEATAQGFVTYTKLHSWVNSKAQTRSSGSESNALSSTSFAGQMRQLERTTHEALSM